MKNFSHETPCAVKAACTVWAGAKGLQGPDLSASVAKDYQRLPDGFLGLISWQANTEYFWYYKPAFEAAGITETPKTFDEFFVGLR